MTDKQRKARIEFVKKLLELNEFYKIEKLGRKKFASPTYMKDIGFSNYLVSFEDNFLNFGFDNKYDYLPHDKPLKPLREFIKLSNKQQ